MDTTKLFQQFVRFTSAFHQVTNGLTKDIELEDITPLQYKMLEYITVSQSVTLSQISECLHISLPNSSRELKKLMEKQLCIKVIDPIDRRKSDIRLTEKGTTLMNEVFQHIEQKFQERIKNLTEQELIEIEHALHTLQIKFISLH
jgi:DNA-binding MarR family transcriptional regulator